MKRVHEIWPDKPNQRLIAETFIEEHKDTNLRTIQAASDRLKLDELLPSLSFAEIDKDRYNHLPYQGHQEEDQLNQMADVLGS